MTAREPIAIVELDCMFAGSSDASGYWDQVREARSGIVALPPEIVDPVLEYDPTGADPTKAVNLHGGWFPPPALDLLKLGLPPKAARASDRTQLELLHVAYRMVERAGLGPQAEIDRNRARIALGTGPIGPYMGEVEGFLQGRRLAHWLEQSEAFAALPDAARESLHGELQRLLSERFPQLVPDSATGYNPHLAAGRLANRLNFRGGYTAISTTCASSLMSVLQACNWLWHGECDLALAGGSDYSMTRFGLLSFSAAHALTPTLCLPFDERANGTLLGIGCGALLLKRLSDAERAGDRVVALVRGGQISSDGRGESLTRPTLEGSVRMIEGTLADASVSLRTVHYVEAHGTGTPTGDANELAAIQKVADSQGLPQAGLVIGTLKQLIGHLRAGAGIAALVKTALALQHRTLPPVKHIERPRPPLRHSEGPLHYVDEPMPWPETPEPPRALVLAQGFGGINAGIVLEASPA